mmetsp:Transcript_17709/g.49550  ORF Transcript_17709/g.49550 Transcript_17709/m.49550 type:complete len:1558 (-) Transcript_17709:317-4990(-)
MEYHGGQTPALENSLNPGHNLLDVLRETSKTTAQLDMEELQNSCLQEVSPTQTHAAEEEKKKAFRKKLFARLNEMPVSSSLPNNLGEKAKTELAEKVLQVRAKLGTAKFQKVMKRVLEAAGRRFPHVLITYQDLEVQADALVGNSAIQSIGNSVKQMFNLCVPVERQKVTLLSKTSGVLRPGVSTLMLGPPGAGKSMFMKLLSGRLTGTKSLHVSGDIRYNGETMDTFNPQRTAAFVDQEDNHLPTLTVTETFQFSYDCTHPKLAAKDLETDIQNMKKAHQCVLERLEILRKRCGQANEPMSSVTVDNGEASEDAAHEMVDLELNEDSHCETPMDNVALTREEATKIDLELIEALETIEGILSVQSSATYTDITVQVWLAFLGLTVCKDTIVGNALLRGVSGGQRRRVTSGEFLVGHPSALFLDEISTGLDSATTFSVCQLLCESCRSQNFTTVISLLQPPPETVDLFDDILLLAEGRVIYHGPNKDILSFFESLGFACPSRKDKASFLQEVTTAVGQNEYASAALRASKGLSAPGETSPLMPARSDTLLVTTAEIEKAFWETETGKTLQSDFLKAVDEGKAGKPQPKEGEPCEGSPEFWGLIRKKFARSLFHQLPVVLSRQITLTIRNKATTYGRLGQCIIMGILTGLLFGSLEKVPTNSRSYLGVLFSMIMFLAMGNSSQVSVIIGGREVYYKQRNAYFFKSITYVVSMTITQLPITAIEVLLYCTPVYWLVGLVRKPGPFFTLLLICYITSCCLGAIFRSIASFSKDMVMANSVMGLVILMLVLTSGFAIAAGSIPPWWIWIYWISPFSWALRAAGQNEFLTGDPAWSQPSNVTNPACSAEYCTAGEVALIGYDMPIDTAWIWYGILYNTGVFLVMVIVCTLGMQISKPPQQEATVSDKLDDHTASDLVLSQLTKSARSLAQSGVLSSMGKTSKLPFQPLTLVWKDLHYFVPFPKGKDAKDTPKELELLKGITGYAQPGTLTALMGGSGAGKTTLMDVIAGRKTVGRITGDIVVNGHPKEQATWARVCGYCEQMDIHIPYCTVREALEFSANLRLDASVDRARAMTYVDEVMTMVDLWPIANRTIGTPGGEGLSLEQRKRVTIGVELVSNAGVIFMDEPTSGLDAKAAATVMRAVRSIGSSGRTIMVTIHQPSIEIFETFDQLILLQKGGYTIYFGNIGDESSSLISYFRGYKGVEPVPVGYNPATWMLEVTGGAPQTLIAAAPYNFADEWVTNEVSTKISAECDEINARCLKEEEAVKVSGVYAQPFFPQLKEMFGRVNLMYWRAPSYNLTRLVLAVVYAGLFGSLYWQAGNIPLQMEKNGGVLSYTVVTNILGISYSGCMFLGLGNLITAIPIVSLGRSVFYRERAVSMYGVLPYAISSAAIEIPYIIFQVLLFVPIMYGLVGFEFSNARFAYWIVMYICSLSCFTFFGQLLVYITPSPMLAQILSGAFNFFWNIFSGFSLPYDQMPVYLAWINRISPTTWVIYGLVTSQLGDNDTPMDLYGQTVLVSDFLENVFSYYYDFRWYCILIVAAFAIGFMLVSSLALMKLNFNVR